MNLLPLLRKPYACPLAYLLLILSHSNVAIAAESAAGSFEVDEETSVRALEHSLVQSGGLLLPVGKMDVEVGVSFSHSENDVLLFDPANGDVLGNAIDTSNNLSVPLSVRAGLPHETQLDVSIPIIYADEESIETLGNNRVANVSRHGVGIGDVNVTLSKTLHQEKGWAPDVISFVSWDADNGKQSDNGVFLNDGFNEFTGGVTLTKSQDPLVFSTSLSAQVTDEKDNIKPGNQYGLSMATFLAASPSTSLRFSIDQVFAKKTEVNNRPIAGSDRTIALLNMGISSIINPDKFLSLSVGAGLTDDSPNYTFNISLSTRMGLPWHN